MHTHIHKQKRTHTYSQLNVHTFILKHTYILKQTHTYPRKQISKRNTKPSKTSSPKPDKPAVKPEPAKKRVFSSNLPHLDPSNSEGISRNFSRKASIYLPIQRRESGREGGRGRSGISSHRCAPIFGNGGRPCSPAAVSPEEGKATWPEQLSEPPPSKTTAAWSFILSRTRSSDVGSRQACRNFSDY